MCLLERRSPSCGLGPNRTRAQTNKPLDTCRAGWCASFNQHEGCIDNHYSLTLLKERNFKLAQDRGIDFVQCMNATLWSFSP